MIVDFFFNSILFYFICFKAKCLEVSFSNYFTNSELIGLFDKLKH